MKLPSPNARNGAAGLLVAASVAAGAALISDRALAIECALVENDTDVIRERDASEELCPPDPSGKPWRWIPVVGAPPSFDPATQVREGPDVTVEPTRVVLTWNVRSKTPAELDADKTKRIDSIQAETLTVLCDHENRIRVFESKAALNETECKDEFKKLL